MSAQADGREGRSPRRSVSTRLLGILAIQPGEATPALLTFSYLFLVVAAYVLMKAVRDALFIAEFGAVNLPYVMLGIAVLVGLFVSLYIRLARRLSSPKLVTYTLLFFCANVLFFWWFAVLGQGWLYPVIYIWAGLYGIIATTQVWTLANELFTTREAKRLFGVVGAGGILGGAAGGFLGRLAPTIGTPNLLLVVLGILLLATGIVRLLGRHRSAERAAEGPRLRPPRNLTQSLRVIARSGHLRSLAALVFVTAVVTTMVHFQYALVAEQSVPTRDSLTSFFGTVLGSVSILAFFLQLFLTRRFLGYLGVGFSILLLPVSLLSGTIALLTSKALWAAVLMKGSDGTLKHSVDRSCRELMFLPLPAATKIQTKSVIDTVMDRMGDGTAGVLQILITAGLGWGLRASLFLSGAAILGWMVLARRVKGHYVRTLRSSLEHPESRAPAWIDGGEDADARSVVEQTLRRGTEAQKLGALEWVSMDPSLASQDALVSLVRDDPSPLVRRTALAALLGAGESGLPEDVARGLEGEELGALVSVIELLVEPDAGEFRKRLNALLEGVGDTTKLTVVAFLVRRLGPEFEPFARKVFETLLDARAPSRVRTATVKSLALLPDDSPLQELLGPLLEDVDPSVAAAASETAGKTRRAELIPPVIENLGRPRARAGARRGLRSYGRSAVAGMAEGLGDGRRPSSLRLHIPALLGEAGSPKAVAALVRGLGDPESSVRDRCLRALHRLRWRRSDLRPLPKSGLAREVLAECRQYESVVEVSRAIATGPPSAGAEFLLESLRSESQVRFRRVFELLALEYSVPEMDQACRALLDRDSTRRANALEYLDNTLSGPLKRRLVPLVEATHRPRATRPDMGRPISRGEALRRLVEGGSPWLAAGAFHVARVERVEGLAQWAEKAARSDWPALREEAALFLEGSAEGGKE